MFKSCSKYIADEDFISIYGDGVCDINIIDLLALHKAHNKIATVTAIQLEARFGGLGTNAAGVVGSI
jgi:glucose-1-phosphate cytidylyltransferase